MQAALVFEPVWRIINRGKRSSVSLKVGQESVQVIYVRSSLYQLMLVGRTTDHVSQSHTIMRRHICR
jgi:hypothetical protein